ncbi:hypothetical protein ES703_37161 [subsurface metagenome]
MNTFNYSINSCPKLLSRKLEKLFEDRESDLAYNNPILVCPSHFQWGVSDR